MSPELRATRVEALAKEVGSLQAQPEYVKEYGKVLDNLQAKIEEKYSVVGKGLRYIKRLFSRGRRASQIKHFADAQPTQQRSQISREAIIMRKLTASQKIALLERRVANVERDREIENLQREVSRADKMSLKQIKALKDQIEELDYDPDWRV